MNSEQFAEFDPGAWQDDGVLTALPPRKAGWVGTRASELFASVVVFGVGALLSLAADPTATVVVEGRGDASMHPVWWEPFEASLAVVRDADATPPGYWHALGRTVAQWAEAVEAPTESEAEPLV